MANHRGCHLNKQNWSYREIKDFIETNDTVKQSKTVRIIYNEIPTSIWFPMLIKF